MTFNGEIFNYIELREEMIRAGTRFRNRTDTEVCSMLTRKRARFRQRPQRRFRLRHLGPPQATKRLSWRATGWASARLFYTQHAKWPVLFASEVKALLTVRDAGRELDPVALDQIFTFWFPLGPTHAVQGNLPSFAAGACLIAGRRVKRTAAIGLDVPERRRCTQLDPAAKRASLKSCARS